MSLCAIHTLQLLINACSLRANSVSIELSLLLPFSFLWLVLSLVSVSPTKQHFVLERRMLYSSVLVLVPGVKSCGWNRYSKSELFLGEQSILHFIFPLAHRTCWHLLGCLVWKRIFTLSEKISFLQWLGTSPKRWFFRKYLSPQLFFFQWHSESWLPSAVSGGGMLPELR